ncbi:MYXO-CTERM sorting domain-containing protein [Vulgatibacter incomptus]|uniref:Uncharacterized protein n=1 Tax=Vulgatibacter incomptus TaxID=1391653 RepID=A0A0K1P970_9BACT|nr:MYXO-CTERM sorting domain-containing protein [Vulgatibacter incomptus]AKU90083.1 hypothetical protein AKJ08_0470 [Vulgatibacter incomptus]
MTLRVDDTFGSVGVSEGDELDERSYGAVLGDRYFVIVGTDSDQHLMPIYEAGQVHCVDAMVPLERAASIALAPSCYDEALKDGLMPKCDDWAGCSSGGGGPAILTVGAAAALFAALRSRRRNLA